MVIFKKLDFGEDPISVDFYHFDKEAHVPYGFMNE